jgi:hypothetical protein
VAAVGLETEGKMLTLSVRYAFDPDKVEAFKAHVQAEKDLIRRSGGTVLAYFLPTDLAGPCDEALGLVEFPSLAAYERYRATLANDPGHERAASGAGIEASRSIVQRVGDAQDGSLRAHGSTPVERMYFAWDDALSRNDADALLALYAKDAHFESPLVPHLLGRESGVLHGHAELRPLFDLLAGRKPPVRQYHRHGYLTDGRRLIWEYPRDAGKGEQMDFVEAMELSDEGLIQRHCVYWGWFGVRVLQRDEYHR